MVLYIKPTDRKQMFIARLIPPILKHRKYPPFTSKKITRICSKINTREKRYYGLKDMLLERNYPEGIITSAISRANSIPRSVAIMKVARNPTSSMRPVFVVSWDPWLPSVSAITKRHWLSLTQDALMKDIFPEPPLIPYRRQRNIGDLLIRAKAYTYILHPKRKIMGMTKCGTNCPECPYVQGRKSR